MSLSIVINREDTIIIHVVMTGALIAATAIVLVYYKWKFYQRQKKLLDKEEDAETCSDQEGSGSGPRFQ